MKVLNDLLNKYRVDQNFKADIRENYRNELQKKLKEVFPGEKIRFIYGGSLAKETANTISSDADLLCYFHEESELTVQEIYERVESTLRTDYTIESKNSAITVNGKEGEKLWEISVDVVPGKHIKNNKDGDVFLWCRKSKTKLKTNPEKQINFVKESNSKDVIRLIKLYKHFNKFKFKSFFLEVFAIDIVEKKYQANDDIMEKLMKFCSFYKEIGILKVEDPANANNNIMTIHNENEFAEIRDKIKQLWEALATDNSEIIKKCIMGHQVNINEAYEKVAKNHSKLINFSNMAQSDKFNFPILGFYSTDKIEYTRLYNSTVLVTDTSLQFKMIIPIENKVKSVKWIVCNSGYEARKKNSLRGNKYEVSSEDVKIDSNYKTYTREETALYYGNHYVQAIIETIYGRYYSNILTVKIRKSPIEVFTK
jgi:hypothetical protein